MEREINRKAVTHSVAAVLLAVLLATAIYYGFDFQPSFQPISPELKTFSSYDELKNFIKTSMEQARHSEGFYVYSTLTNNDKFAPEYSGAPGYSTTNIQVVGVDEADVVKTDGEFLYVVSGSSIYILRAYPPEQAEILSKIALNETYSLEIYVNGGRLAVLGKHYQYYPLPMIPEYNPKDIIIYPYAEESFIKVYDISDRENPVLKRTISLNGTISGSRMIGNYVYAVFNQPATLPSGNETDFEVNLPKIAVNSTVIEVQPTEISYIDVPNFFYYFTTIVAVNIQDDVQEPTYEPILTGVTSSMYVSLNNIYLVVPNTNMLILSVGEEANEETLVYRIKLDEEKIVFEAKGSVSGYVLNQFSMDEYNGFFRIATTKWTIDSSENNLYILDMSLNIVGKLEGLASGERIYSARFMGERCYLVTFRQVDPFFVIDLYNPAEPKVLGYLKIPGFSGYLHPYDENHIIGVGIEENKVKLSLFDVTNVIAPIEKAKFVVPSDWSSTPVLYDHKAFLFDKSKQLLALPVSIWSNMNNYEYNGTWQGAYVFNLSLEQGFTLKGNITHQSNAQFESNLEVKRILYIENFLYTISDEKIKINSLEDLVFINGIELV
ncbi:MAG: beta-propeller domain-containing protein [archaeon]|nr:beta-propeller domain-containing protein [archaeon]MCP8313227.1 beta-propeller domain-containing protein [archaeon]